MVAGGDKSLAVIEPRGEVIFHVGIQHHQVALLLNRLSFEPGGEFLTDLLALAVGLDEEIIDIEFLAAPEAHAHPKAATADHLLALKHAGSPVTQADHGMEPRVENCAGDAGIVGMDQREKLWQFLGRQFADGNGECHKPVCSVNGPLRARAAML